MSGEQNTNKSNNRSNKLRWFGLTALFLLALVSLLLLAGTGLAFGLETVYAGKFYPGISIDSYAVGGKTKAEVAKHFEEMEKKFDRDGIIFKAEDKTIKVTPLILSETDLELSKQIVAFDWNASLDDAFTLGRSGQRIQNFLEQVDMVLRGRQIGLSYIIDDQELLNILKSEFSKLEKPTLNAGLKISGEKIEITQEQDGLVFDYPAAVSQFKLNVAELDFKPIEMKLSQAKPLITKTEAEAALNEVQKIIDLAPLTLKGDEKEWEITVAQLKKFLEFQELENRIVVGLNKEKVVEYLKKIAEEIDIKPQDAKFQMKDGKVSEFQQAIDGLEVNLDTTYEKINQRIIDKNNSPIDLEIAVTKSATAIDGANNLGIKELIGRGTSNFKGSPTNRRINITNGAKILNGILIPPGEEFSMIKSLGEIDGEHGFKQELVIKGDRTIPEYGGGLCQIGTTAFRAALRSGLPITQRRNHSYRVTYYEPAGMDATIYDPQPDLRFLNDTGYHILFTTRIEGNDLIFDFYGTKDGRKIEIAPDPPRIFNVTKPGEPRMIETADLKPGEKKRVESPHAGADTYFKYTVTYPNGDIKEKEFNSHYVAWPEVWLVGKAEATSTEPTAAVETPAPAN